MAVAGYTNTQIEKFVLDGSQYKGELTTIARELRKQEKTAKQVALAQQHLAGTLGKVEKQTKLTSGAMAKGTIAATVIMGAYSRLSRSIGSLVETGLTWNDWIGDNAAALQGMQDASAGIISKLDLVRARTKLTTGDFQASESQLRALSKAAVIYARVMKVDMRNAIDSVSDAIITGRDKAFRSLGIDIQFTGDKSSKTAQALQVLEERFGGVVVEASNANEKIAQVSTSLSDATGEMGNAIIKSDLVQNSMSDLSMVIRGMVGNLEAAVKGLRSFALDALPLMGLAGSDVEKILLAGASAAQKVDAQVKKYRAEYQAAVETGPQQPASIGKAGGRKSGRASGKGGSGGRVKSQYDQLMGLIPKGDKAPKLSMESFGFETFDEEAAAKTQRLIASKEELGIVLVDERAKTLDAEAAQRKHNQTMQLGRRDVEAYTNAVAGAATGLATGFVGAIDAAITSGANLGWAMLDVVKQTSMALSGQFFARAAASFAAASIAASNPFTAWEAPILSAQGSAYLGYGALAAAGGLGLSIVSAAGQGKGAFSSGDGGGASTPSVGGGSDYRPSSVSQDSEDKVFDPTINIYLGDGDAALGTHLRKKLRAEMAEA